MTVSATIFTDPACPYGYTAERQRLQVLWHYGPGVEITSRVIVLNEQPKGFGEMPGFTPERLRDAWEGLRAEHGMPIVPRIVDGLTGTWDACVAYVGAQLHAPERAERLRRELSLRWLAHGEALHDRATLHTAASDAGIDPAQLDDWLTDEAVIARVRDDMRASRDPIPEALALPHRLAAAGDGKRYTAGSIVFEADGRRAAVPGFQPWAAYEVAMAAVAPQVVRRDPAGDVAGVLAWADLPLATAEVAAVRAVSVDAARGELEAAGARFTPVGSDGVWSAA